CGSSHGRRNSNLNHLIFKFIFAEHYAELFPCAAHIVFEFTEPMKAITMRAEPAADYFHIIMPMNLN
ncbi:MAG: hypothetical protein ACFNQG_06745, partial [Treponema socranskii subsp. buccale]